MASSRKSSRSRLSVEQTVNTSPATSAKRKRSASPSHSNPVLSSDLQLDPTDGATESVLDSSEDVEIEEELVTVDVVLPSTQDVDLTVESGLDPEEEEYLAEQSLDVPGNSEPAANEEANVETEKTTTAVFVFKDPNFVHSNKGASGNKRARVWKNLKQIVAAERTLPWGPDDVTYGSIDAPPSFKPAKKYSDVSGLESKYTDPQTKMRYANADEYRRVRMLPGDIITGCLALRKANTLVP